MTPRLCLLECRQDVANGIKFMKVAFYLNIISPHQLPLAREVVRLVGEASFRYVYAEDFHAERKAMGWSDGDVPRWCVKGDENTPELMDADLVYTGIRCPFLMAKRSAVGKKTVYFSERWFKPIPVLGMLLPGWLRMLSPRYRKLARQMVELLNTPTMRYLSCGPWAAKDLVRIGLQESHIIPWGYFVAPGEYPKGRIMHGDKLRVLWVGKISRLKRVDTIVEAVGRVGGDVELTIVGDGSEKRKIEKLAKDKSINFLPSQPIGKIREVMRQHDVYVFSSNGMDGWGAVVNEALEEGMYVIGTKETGASASILSKDALYSCGDKRRLAMLLARFVAVKKFGELRGQGIGQWTATNAAKRLMSIAMR